MCLSLAPRQCLACCCRSANLRWPNSCSSGHAFKTNPADTPTLRLEPKPRLPQQRPPTPPRSDPHRDLTHQSCTEPFSGWNGLTRKCSREGEAASGLKEYFRVGRSGSSASVAAVRVAAGRVRGFPGGGWSGAGSRSRTARPLSLGSGGGRGRGAVGLRLGGGHLAAGRGSAVVIEAICSWEENSSWTNWST